MYQSYCDIKKYVITVLLLWGAALTLCANDSDIEGFDSEVVLESKASTGGTITAIKVFQNKRISYSSIVSKLSYNIGDTISASDIEHIVEHLYATSLFAHVSAEMVDGELLIYVRELPSVNSVSFEGNRNLDKTILEKDLGVEERQILSKERLRTAVERLYMIYRQAGFFHASVKAQVIYQDNNRVDLIFSIKEGEPAHVGDVMFFGNKAASSSALKSLIATKPYRWWRILKTGSLFHAENLDIDQSILESYYFNRGYLDFQVKDTVAQLSPLLEKFTVSYHVVEGRPYTVKDITFENTVPHTSIKRLPNWRSVRGETYVHDFAQDDAARLERAFARNGFPYVRVKQVNVKDPLSQTVVIQYTTYRIAKTMVRRVVLVGNNRTFDAVLYPLVDITEGDLLDERYIKSTLYNLRRTGFFESVSVEKRPILGDPDGVEVRFVLKERPTGQIRFKMQYKGDLGVGVEAELNDPNFLGKGKVLRSSALTGARQWDIGVTFIDPSFNDLNVAVGGGVNFGRRKVYRPTGSVAASEQDALYSLASRSVRTFCVMPFRRYWSSRYEYKLAMESFDVCDQKIYSIKRAQFDNYDFSLVKDKRGAADWPESYVWLSRARAGIVYDRRDRRFDATKGLLASVMFGVSGLGGNVRNFTVELDADYHRKLTDSVTLRARAYGRILRPWSEKYATRILDRHRLGGARTLRGFREWGVGPRTIYGEVVGGDTMFGGTLELLFSLGLPKEAQFRGVLFMDMGTNWDSYSQLSRALFINERSLRVTVGVGIRWASPMGVIDIAYGIPLRHSYGDDLESISFGLQSMMDAQDDFV